MSENTPRGWHSRGYLPHFNGGEKLQFITLHLGDALPLAVVQRWKIELAREKDEDAKKALFWRVEKYVDQNFGACFLRQNAVAAQAQESLLRHHLKRYKLIAWVIMPNHTHFLIKPLSGHSLSEIMKKYKSFTAHECNRLLDRTGRFWQEDYFDRYIRNRNHFENAINYIEMNPVKAGLCVKPGDWEFSSAHCKWSANGSSASNNTQNSN